MKANKLKDEALELREEGYDLGEIAEELGIPTSKVKEWIGDDEPEEVMVLNRKERKVREGKLKAFGKLKSKYDDLIAEYAENLEGEEVSLEEAEDFLEKLRKLEFEFRNVARDFEVNHEESEHWLALDTWVSEMKEKIKEAKRDADDEEDYVFELDFEEDFLEKLDDLRFELVNFEEND
jgi:predicted transcriptional regulator